MKSLRDKVVVVPGAGSGMGREIALLCAKRGAVVALADSDVQGAEKTAQMIRARGGRCSVHAVDTSNRAAVAWFAEAVVEQHGFSMPRSQQP